ncbi:MAG TPA: NTF2-like N-terminal transpeptidase domain-containing protein, partial [Bellilinea sp.]|nr:NTF2-like N-terminal transpeptidase domain-containing protein [Bellilinea sp.]
MKFRNLIILAALLLTACSNTGANTPLTPAGTPTPALKDPVVNVTPAPDVEKDAKAFLDNWVNAQFPAMYAQLSKLSRDAMLEANFVNRLREVNASLTLKQMSYQIKQSLVKNPSEAQVAYRVNYDTVLVGTISKDIVMNLSLQEGGWKVAWDENLILPELGNGNQLRMEITVPPRGNIYDRTGEVLVSETEAVAMGIIPERLVEGAEKSVNNTLGKVLDRSGDAISKMYENAGANWYIGIGDSAMEDMQGQY